MEINTTSTIPIYIQIAENIKNMILQRELKEEEQAPSTNQIAEFYKLNPATALKGLNLLVDEQILYKKRGLGMFVKAGAVSLIKDKRKKEFVETYVMEMLRECKKLDLNIEEVIALIKENERRA